MTEKRNEDNRLNHDLARVNYAQGVVAVKSVLFPNLDSDLNQF